MGKQPTERGPLFRINSSVLSTSQEREDIGLARVSHRQALGIHESSECVDDPPVTGHRLGPYGMRASDLLAARTNTTERRIDRQSTALG